MSLLSMVKYFSERSFGVYVALPPAKNKSYESLLAPHLQGKIYVKSMSWNKPLHKMGTWDAIKQYLYASYKSGGWHFAPVFKLFKFIRKNRIDLVHTNTLLSMDGALAAKLAGIPHLQHVREPSGNNALSIVEFPLQKHPAMFRKWMGWLHAKVIANSDFTMQVSRLFFPENKLSRIYNPIEDKFFEAGSQPKSQPPPAPLRVGMVANVTAKWKNHELFIDAAKAFTERNPEVQSVFEIYGSLPIGNTPYLARLQEKIRVGGLEKVVIFKGREDDPLKIYEALDVLVHPVHNEAFGRIYVEAMAQGIPVVALRGGGATELIADGETGLLVAEPDGALFAEKLEWLLSHPQARRAITEKAFRFAQQFRPQVVLPQLERLYGETIGVRL